MEGLVVAFAQSKIGTRYLLGVFDNQVDLRAAYDSFKRTVGGDVALISTEINQSALLEM